jgi:hypothetical protein
MKLRLSLVFRQRALGAACLAAVSACHAHVDKAQLYAIRDAAISQATADGAPVLLWSVGWTVLDAYEVGAVDLSICFSNTDAERDIQKATFFLKAYDQTGDIVLGRLDEVEEVQVAFAGSLAPGQTTEAEWPSVWSKQIRFSYENVAEVVIRRIDIAYANGESCEMLGEWVLAAYLRACCRGG